MLTNQFDPKIESSIGNVSPIYTMKVSAKGFQLKENQLVTYCQNNNCSGCS